MAELQNIAPQGGAGLSAPAQGGNAAFTDAQVDEYREQDRWLPVRLIGVDDARRFNPSIYFLQLQC